MFEGFEGTRESSGRRRMAISTGASIALYGALASLPLLCATRHETVAAVREVAVVFSPPMPAEPPAPAPEPAPPVPSEMKVKKRRAPKPAAALREVRAIPEARPEEAETNEAAPVEADPPSAEGTPGSAAPPSPAPPPPPPPPPPKPPERRAPIKLPESATPPVPDPNNGAPEYPEAARARGVEGEVILRVVVSEAGSVTEVAVLRGEEPFISAAVAMVKRWKYSPAIVEGRPTPVYRTLKIPFRLKA